MLTENQIQYLYQFCAKHYVRYYDVQVELVDHLAASIENELAKDPGLGFEGALNKVYKGFGVMGFSKLVAAREKATQKLYRKKYWQLFFDYFTLPKIGITAILFLALLTPFYYFGYDYNSVVRWVILCYTFTYWIVIGLLHFRSFKKKYPRPKQSLLITESVWSPDNVFFVVILTQALFFLDRVKEPLVIVSFFQVALFVLVYVAMAIGYLAGIRAYKNMYSNAQKNYPSAFKS